MSLTADDIAAIVAALQATQPPPPSPAPALLDAEAAAALLDVPKSWVMAEARAGRIPHVKLGKYVRFEADELEAWWRSRASGPRPRRRVG
jgi:excisionase family DNA binding protein